MVYKIYSIWDRKAGVWLTPMFSLSDGTIGRELDALVNDSNHMFNRFAEDYELHTIGSWDCTDCSLVIHGKPELIANLEVFKRSVN